MVRNLNDSPLERMVDAQQHARRENPFESASVRNGQVRFIGGRLLIDAGGTLQVIGQFDGNGNFQWSGAWKFDSGDGEIAGDVKLTGDFELLGKLLAGDVRIEDGKVYVGGMVLDPAVAGGALTFPNGSRLEADDENNGERLIAGSAVVNVGAVTSIRKGPSSVIVASDEVTVNAAGGGDITLLGRIVASRADMPTIVDPNVEEGTVRILASGALARTVLA